jgi:hypothetical protein
MTKKTWEELEHYFADDRVDYFCGAVEIHEIKEAEKKLRLDFSPAYIEFIKKYGGAMICGDLVYGLRKQDDMDINTWSVVDKTNFYKHKQKWPDIEDWYIISDDGSGNPIGCKPDGSVWLSDHDAGFEQVKLADNFEEFLEKLLDNSLYE